MKILFVSEHYKHNVQGGGEINLTSLCEALAERHDVHVLTSFGKKKSVEVMDGVTVYCTVKTGSVDTLLGNVQRSLFFPRSVVRELKLLLSKQNYDVIHLIGSTLQIAPLIKKISTTPLVATVESYLALCPKGDFICGDTVDISRWSFFHFALCVLKSPEIGKMVNKWYLRFNPVFWVVSYLRYIKMRKGLFAVHPLAVSSFIQVLLKKFYGVESTVVPNFVDVPLFRRAGKANNKPVVLYLGSLTRYKGVEVLLRAAKGCVVKIYGAGVLKMQLLEYITKNHIDATIYDPVPYAEIPSVYAGADIVVFPSLWPEPFGRIAIEAMAAVKTVIGSDIGGISETLKDVGVLVKPGDVGQLRVALQRLLKDEELREKMSVAGRKRAMIYSKEKVVNELVGVYEGVI